MNTNLFLLSLSIAVLVPIIAISYLRPILTKVMLGLCDAQGGAEFWIRCAYLLAVCGSLLLVLSLGQFEDATRVLDALRRTLLLVFAAVFVSVAIISRNVWSQVRELLAQRSAGPATPGAAL